MVDPNPWPKVDYGRNTNTADVLIIGAGISGKDILPGVEMVTDIMTTGMTAAIDMIRKGNKRNFIIIEKGNQLVSDISRIKLPDMARS